MREVADICGAHAHGAGEHGYRAIFNQVQAGGAFSGVLPFPGLAEAYGFPDLIGFAGAGRFHGATIFGGAIFEDTAHHLYVAAADLAGEGDAVRIADRVAVRAKGVVDGVGDSAHGFVTCVYRAIDSVIDHRGFPSRAYAFDAGLDPGAE
jgi:hypothetical protein